MPETNKPQTTKPISAWPAAQAEATSQRAAEAIQQNGAAAGEAMRRSATATSEMMRQGAQAEGEAVQRTGKAANEAVRRGVQAMAEGQRQIAQDSAQAFQAVSQKMAQATQVATADMRRLMTLPQAAEGGLRDVQHGVAGLVEGMMQTNLRAAQEMMRFANPAPMVELQQRFARQYMDTMMQGAAVLLRAFSRTANETVRPLEEHIHGR